MAISRRDALLALLRVQPGELERVALMLALSLASVGGVVITGQIVGRSLFLSGLPASAIPLRFIAPPLVLVLVTAGYSRRLAAGRQASVILGTFLALAAAVFVARLLAGTALRGDRVFLLALFSLLELAGSLAMILYWTIAGVVFDPREARRLFGLISSGSAISNVSFGLFLGEVARRVRPESLMWLVVASLLAAALMVARLLRHQALPASPGAPPAPRLVPASAGRPPGGALAHLRQALASPLVATLAAIALVISLVANLTDYQLDLALKRSYGADGASMIGFLARLRLVAGVGAFLVQVLVAGRMMERFGVLPALLLLPGLVGLGSLGILATGGALLAVAVPRAADVMLKYSINDSAFNLLYLPLAPETRSRAKALVEGILKPPVVAVLGLLFLGANRFAPLSIRQWAVPVLALVGLWVFLVARVEGRYVKALAQSIALRRLDPAREAIVFSDPSSRRVLAAALDDPSPTRVIHALNLIRAAPGDWAFQVSGLLGHGSAEVRTAALEVLAESPIPELAPAVAAHMGDDQALVRAAAIRAYGRALGGRAVGVLSARLDDPSPFVRGAAVVALVQYGGLGGFLHAGGPLHAMLEAERPAERREGARVLGSLGVPSFYHPLVELVRDADRSVRLAAIEAAEWVAAPELRPVLEEALDEPGARRAAVIALVACAGGDPAVLAGPLRDPSRPRPVRRQLARSLPRWRERAVPVLAGAMTDEDEDVRGAVLSALGSLRETLGVLDLDRARLARRLDEEARLALDHWLCAHDLRPALGECALLSETLARRAEGDRDRIVDLLALLHPDLHAPALREALSGPEPRRRAEAVELIDSVAGDARTLVVPCLAEGDAARLEAAERRLGLARASPETRLGQLGDASDPWLRACALDAAGRVRAAGLRARLEAASMDPAPLVAGAARVALQRLDGGRAWEAGTMPIAPLERILFLKQVSIFRDLPAEEISGLLPIVEEVEFAPATTIIRQGDTGDSLFIVVEGSVAIEVDGRPRGAGVGPREVIGEMAILTGRPRTATCTALTQVLALSIRREPFWELMQDRPEVSLGVIRTLVDRLQLRDRQAAGARRGEAVPAPLEAV
jgi:HEAT repeat protein